MSRAYGLADRSRALPSTPETRFNLGSINKTFTAIAIAQLIQQGRVTLDDALAKYLPDYPNAAAAAKITIRDLVTHRSGVATFMRADFGNLTVAEMVKRVGAEPQAFAPGERQEYSNGGYVVLGRVVEVVSGEPYSTYVADHIYRPAGMTQSGFVDAGTAASGAALAYSAAGGRGGPMSARPVEPGNPAGGGYSTASDLFNFARALRSGRLLDQRMTDYVLNGTFAGTSGPRFGFALREQIVGAHRFIGNGGGAPGVNAEFRFEPAGDFTVVVLSNTSPPSATELLSAIMNQIAGTTESRASAAGSAQAPAAPAPTRAAANSGVRAEIEALHAKMTAAFRERPESVAAFYTPDARILGGGQRASGDQIRLVLGTDARGRLVGIGNSRHWRQRSGALDTWAIDVVTSGRASHGGRLCCDTPTAARRHAEIPCRHLHRPSATARIAQADPLTSSMHLRRSVNVFVA